MPNLAKQIASVAAPVLLVLISTSIFLRYAEGAGAEIFIAIAIGVALVSLVVVSLLTVRRQRRVAQAAGQELARKNPGASFVLAELDRRALRALRTRYVRLDARLSHGLVVIRVDNDGIDVHDVASLRLLATWLIGVDLMRFVPVMTNRGNAHNEPCLRLTFSEGVEIDMVVYEISTGRWPSEESLSRLPRVG